MNFDFDFSPLVMGLIVLVTLVRIFTAKPKVDSDHAEGSDEDVQSGERRVQTIEELLGQFVEKQAAPQGPSEARPVKISEERKSVESRAKKQPAISTFGGDLSSGEIGLNSDDTAGGEEINFDLRKAVIMSEILARKYDE